MVIQNYFQFKLQIKVIIFLEIFSTLILFCTSYILWSKYKKRGKIHPQTKTLSILFFYGSVSLIFLIIAEILHYYYSIEVDKTELAIISSYSISLVFLVLVGRNLFQLNTDLFPSYNHRFNNSKRINHITWILIFLLLLVPGSFKDNLFPEVYLFKFLSVLFYIIVPVIFFTKSSYRVYTFVGNKSFLRKIIIFDTTLLIIIVAYIFAIISRINVTFFGNMYSWAYFTFAILFLIASILGYISIRTRLENKNKLEKSSQVINE